MCKCSKIEIGVFEDKTGESRVIPKFQNINAYGALEKEGMYVKGSWAESRIIVVCRLCGKCYIGQQHFDYDIRQITRVQWDAVDPAKLECGLRRTLASSEGEVVQQEYDLAYKKAKNAEQKILLDSLFGEK